MTRVFHGKCYCIITYSVGQIEGLSEVNSRVSRGKRGMEITW